jgi:hypothetical protein
MNWENFAKYVGVQGIMGVLLLLSIIGLLFAKIEVPQFLYNMLTLVIGFYFAKNGVGIVAALKRKS